MKLPRLIFCLIINSSLALSILLFLVFLLGRVSQYCYWFKNKIYYYIFFNFQESIVVVWLLYFNNILPLFHEYSIFSHVSEHIHYGFFDIFFCFLCYSQFLIFHASLFWSSYFMLEAIFKCLVILAVCSYIRVKL